MRYPSPYFTGKGDETQLLEMARTYFGAGKRYFDTYALQEDLRVFYIKKLNGLFYTNNSSTVIFVDSLDFRKFHALQMMIPKYWPALFADNPLTPEEAELLKSLGLRSSAEYERLIEEFTQQFDMRGEIIRTRLKGFETVFEQERAQQIQQEIETHQSEYQTILANLRNTSRIIQDKQIILAGLQCQIEETRESELMAYFLCNKNLSVIKVQGTTLEFVVHGYADVFDEEAFETYCNNTDSYLYQNVSVSKEQLQQLYRAIFSEKVYKLRLCGAYRADMKNNLTPVENYTFPPESHTYVSAGMPSDSPSICTSATMWGLSTRRRCRHET